MDSELAYNLDWPWARFLWLDEMRNVDGLAVESAVRPTQERTRTAWVIESQITRCQSIAE